MHLHHPPPSSFPQTSSTTTSLTPIESNSASLDNIPLPDSHQSHQHGVPIPAAPPTPQRRGHRYRRKYNDDERLEVKAVRAIGACDDCRNRRVKCYHARANLQSTLDSSGSPSSNVQSPARTRTPTTSDSGYMSHESPIRAKTSIQGYVEDLSSGGNPVPWYLRTFAPVIGEDEELTLDNVMPKPDSMASFFSENSEDLPRKDLGSYIPNFNEAPIALYYARNPVPGENAPYRLSTGVQNIQPARARSMTSTPRSSTNRVQKRRRGGAARPNIRPLQKNPPASQPVSDDALESLSLWDGQSNPAMDWPSPLSYIPPHTATEPQLSQPQDWIPGSNIGGQFASINLQSQHPSLPPNPYNDMWASTEALLGITSLPMRNISSVFPNQQQPQLESQQQPRFQMTDYGHTYGGFPTNNFTSTQPGNDYSQVTHPAQPFSNMPNVYVQPTVHGSPPPSNSSFSHIEPQPQPHLGWSKPSNYSFDSAHMTDRTPSLATNNTGSSQSFLSPNSSLYGVDLPSGGFPSYDLTWKENDLKQTFSYEDMLNSPLGSIGGELGS